jgi:hypothetical protein
VPPSRRSGRLRTSRALRKYEVRSFALLLCPSAEWKQGEATARVRAVIATTNWANATATSAV